MKNYWELKKNENIEIIGLKKKISKKELELFQMQHINICKVKVK